MKVILTFFLVCLLVCCKSQSATQTVPTSAQNILELVGKDADQFANQSGKYKLYVQRKDEKFPSRLVSALVVNSKTSSIVWKGKFVPGHIKWVGETTLEILDIPGMIKSNESLADYKKIVEINPIKKP